MRALCLAIIALAFTSLIFAQQSDTPQQDPNEGSELLFLEFHTYDKKWTRYKNVDADGNPVLHVAGVTKFPFKRIVHNKRLKLADLRDADTLAELFAAHDFSYGEAAMDGVCDSARQLPDSDDIFCVPGAAAMPPGQILYALYHSDTGELLALTETIDNKNSVATNRDWRATPTPEPTEEPRERIATCGPYEPGRWISAAQYFALGYELPIRGEGVNKPFTDFQCVLPDMGDAYLQAYHFSDRVPSNGGGAEDKGSGNGDDSGDNGDDGGGNNPSDNNDNDDNDDFVLN